MSGPPKNPHFKCVPRFWWWGVIWGITEDGTYDKRMYTYLY